MVTNNTSLEASRSNTLILGSGLSGMIAAYINARAIEDNAAEKENWQAQQAFRPRRAEQRNRKIRPGGTGTAMVS